MVELEVLVAVGRHDGHPVAGLDAELVLQGVAEAEDPVGVLAERAPVVAVDDGVGLVGEGVQAGEEQPVVHELLHAGQGR